jgi:hypothetical protein
MLSRLENDILGNAAGLESLDDALFRSNDRILSNQDKRRLIIDLDSTEDPANIVPIITVHRDSDRPSAIKLPVIPR